MNKTILSLAKMAIRDGLTGENSIDREDFLKRYPAFGEHRATFVTLMLEGNLRGCIGSLIAYRPLIDDLMHNAKAAAFEDPRFYPLSMEEFKKVSIEVSLLTPPQEVFYDSIEDLKSKINVGEDGIILQSQGRKATFLPQVWEQLPTFELFFAHLCQKAGLSPAVLGENPEIWKYSVEKIK